MATTDKKKERGAYEAGQTARVALQVARGAPRLLGEASGVPGAVRSAGNAIGGFTRGLTGADRAQPVPAAPAAPAVQPAAGQAPSPGMDFARPAPQPGNPMGGQAPGNTRQLPNAPPMPNPGSPQTFTGSNGVTRQLPSYAPAGGVQSQSFGGAAAPVQRTLSQPVVAPDNPTRHAQPSAQGGIIANPSSSSATGGVYGGEDKRRLEIALATTGRGSPSVRRGLMEAYMQQQGAQNTAALAGQNAGAAADLQQQKDVAAANEAFAGRRLDADQFNVGTDLQREETQAQGQRVMRTLTDEGGNANVLRNDGSLTPITDANGQPVREQQQTALTAPDLLKAYSDQRAAITEGMGAPEEKSAALAALDADPLFAELRGGKVQHGAPNLEAFTAAAKKAGSKMTPDQLAAAYNERYGN